MTYRRDIEGLRALAVIAVLLYHAGVPGLGGGFVGVDVFFVISGYLITSLLVDERSRTGRISILRFYARRARRLLPISTTVLVATALVGLAVLPPTRLETFGHDLLAAAGFSVNLLFAHRGTDYLTAALEPSPLLHYWSLAVEEQFYVVWPALIAILTLGATGARSVGRRVGTAMAAVVAVSFTLSTLLTATQPTWSYFGLHTRAWELGIGAFFAAVAPTTARLAPHWRSVLGWSGITVIAVSCVAFGRVATFPGSIAAIPVLATAAVLVAGDATDRGPVAVLRSAPLTWAGTRSYSLYLWHWPALVLAEAWAGDALGPVSRLVVMSSVVVVAEIGYRLIEQPVRHSVVLATHPRRAVALGGALVVAGLCVGLATGTYRPDLSTGVVAAAPPPAVPTSTTVVPTSSLAPSESSTSTTAPAPPRFLSMSDAAPLPAIVDALQNIVAPDNLRPSVLEARNDVPPIYDDGCHEYLQSGLRADCVFGDPAGTVTIALWGDSHAAQWFSAVNAMATEQHWRLLSLTQGGCPFLDIAVYNIGAAADFTHCEPWRRAVIDRLSAEGTDVVLMSQYFGLRQSDGQKAIPPSAWSALLPPLIDELRASGIEPIILGDSPDPTGNAASCVADHRRDITPCNVDPIDPRAEAIESAIRAIRDTYKVGFFEPRRLLCTDRACPPVVGDLLVYRDDHHLSDSFAEWMAPAVAAFLVPAIEESISAE